MSGEGSEPPVPEETDHAPTRFGYGDGGVPLYVGFVWVLFIATYLVVMAALMLPDFLAWARP